METIKMNFERKIQLIKIAIGIPAFIALVIIIRQLEEIIVLLRICK